MDGGDAEADAAQQRPQKWFAWLDVPMLLLRTQPAKFTALFLAAFGAVWLTALFAFPSFYLDTYEMFAFGHELQLGYWKHPPLPPWLVELAFRATGGWPQSQHFLAVGAAVLALYFVYRLGAKVAGPVVGAAAAAISVANYYFTRPIESFNHNIAQLPAWALTTYLYRQAFIEGKRWLWVALGASAAILIYTKYSGGFLLVVLAAHALLTAEGRARLKTPGPWIAIALCLLLLAPHLFWLVASDFSALRFPFGATGNLDSIEARLWSALSFCLVQLAIQLPMLVLVGVAVLPLSSRIVLPSQRPSGFDFSLVLAAAVLPIVLTGLTTLASGTVVRTEVGGSLVALSGLAIILCLPTPLVVRAPRLLTAAWLVVLLGVPGFWVASIYSNAQASGAVTRELWPARTLSLAMQQNWSNHVNGPLSIVVGDVVEADYVALYTRPTASVFIDADFRKSPWIDAARLDREGALIIWRARQDAVQAVPEAYRRALEGRQTIVGEPYALPLGFGGRTAIYGWAIVLPKAGEGSRGGPLRQIPAD